MPLGHISFKDNVDEEVEWWGILVRGETEEKGSHEHEGHRVAKGDVAAGEDGAKESGPDVGGGELEPEILLLRFPPLHGWRDDSRITVRGLAWRKYALEAIIKLLFISLFHDKCLLFMLELY